MQLSQKKKCGQHEGHMIGLARSHVLHLIYLIGPSLPHTVTTSGFDSTSESRDRGNSSTNHILIRDRSDLE